MRRLLIMLAVAAGTAFSQQSPHGQITIPCEACHTADSWEMRKDATFDHASTGFALAGKHRVLQCASCHQDLTFTGKSPDCASCHTDVHRGELGANCLRCHSNDSWVVSDMKDRHQQTRFPLFGNHAAVPCDACHVRASTYQYAGAPVECIACHRADFDATTAPPHAASNFPVDCARCHLVDSPQWKGGFNHAETGFPLLGAHRAALCSDCHANNVFTKLPTDCYSCHAAQYAATTNPSHTAGTFSHDCSTCHSNDAWSPATFDHNSTAFPLTGDHAQLQCAACHTNGNYHLVYTGCAQCHGADFAATTNPSHTARNFSQQCQTCHTTAAWQTTTFDHTTTAFPLSGAHGAVQCATCHVNNNYNLTYTGCYACHQADFTGTSNPSHATLNFSHTCETCHSTTSWQTTTFDHTTTAFPLTGAHGAIQCATCHVNNNYNLAYSGCYACHQADFTSTNNPAHATLNFSHTCETCHSTAAWQPANFDHSATSFPLSGAHGAVQCATCHVNNNYNLAYTGCFTCHQADYSGTTNPNHVTLNFSQQCQTCHSTTNWSTTTFDHSTTAFPLTGAHGSIQCSTCHVNNNYSLQYTGCYTCHQSDFAATTNPSHTAQSFSHTCETCHSTTAWQPATFDHSKTAFPLTGAHGAIQCSTCHVNGNYTLVYSGCYTCHQADYAGTTNPNHTTLNFSHSCETCHSTTDWNGASFNHSTTAFALTGAHTSVACATCHANNNYQLVYTDCYQCHQANFQQPTDPNHVAANFSHNCTTCHTTTAWTPSTFNHDQAYFRIWSGRHLGRWSSCYDCHTNNADYSVFSCFKCHSQSATDPHHTGVSGYSYSSPACYSCHRNV